MIRSILIAGGALACAISAVAAEPVRRAGQWEVTIRNAGGPMQMGPMTHKICFKTDKSLSEISNGRNPMAKDCSPPQVSTSGATITVDSQCKNPMGGQAHLHAVITPNGTDAYHSETQIHMEGVPQGMPSDMTMIADAKRLGPCQPGDQQVD